MISLSRLQFKWLKILFSHFVSFRFCCLILYFVYLASHHVRHKFFIVLRRIDLSLTQRSQRPFGYILHSIASGSWDDQLVLWPRLYAPSALCLVFFRYFFVYLFSFMRLFISLHFVNQFVWQAGLLPKQQLAYRTVAREPIRAPTGLAAHKNGSKIEWVKCWTRAGSE